MSDSTAGPVALPPALSASAPPSPSKRNIATKRRLYAEARVAGCTNREASIRAGINESTGSKWAKSETSETSETLSKDATLELLESAIKSCPVQYKSSLAAMISKLRGWDKAVEASDAQAAAPLRSLVASWWDERERERGATRSETPGSPQASASGGDRSNSPTATDPQKVSDPPIQNSEKVEEVRP